MIMLKRVAGWVISAEPLLLIVAVPVLVMPASYLWKAQRGLNAYDALGDPSLAWPGPGARWRPLAASTI